MTSLLLGDWNTCYAYLEGYTLNKILMDTLYYIPAKTVAQLNYGEGAFGTQSYGCETGAECIVEQGAATPGMDVGTPNTGLFGMSQSAAIATTSGVFLVAVALISGIAVLVSKARRSKESKE